MPDGASSTLSYTTASVLNQKRVKLTLPLFSEKESRPPAFWSSLSAEERNDSVRSLTTTQTGDFIEVRRLGNESLWGIAGQVKDFWEERLAPQIERIQSKYGRQIFRGNDTIKEVGCWMVGTLPDNVIPTVVIVSGDKKFNKRLAKHINRDGVFIASGFRLRAIPTWVTAAAESIVDPHHQVSNSSFDGKGRKDNGFAGVKVNFGTPFVSVSKDEPCETNRAIMGGIIAIGDQCYGLTVAHVFQKTNHRFDKASDDREKDLQGLALYDPLEDSDDDDEETDNCSTDDDRTEGNFWDEEPPVEFVPHDVLLDNASLARGQSQRLGVFEGTNNRAARPSRTITGPYASLDLDWGIISFDRRQDYCVNRDFIDSRGRIGTVNKIVAYPPSENAAVLRSGNTSVSSALDVASISDAFTLLSMPGSQSFQRAYVFDFCCDSGTCGAWVIDRESGDAYGAIVANSQSLGRTYCLPLNKIFESISYAWDGILVNLPPADLIFSGHWYSPEPNSTINVKNSGREISTSSHAQNEFAKFLASQEVRDKNAEWSNESTNVPGAPHSSFITESVLRDYFNSKRLAKILEEIHPFGIPYSVDEATIRAGYLRIFAILLSIGRGVEISSFVNKTKSLADNRLPFGRRPPKEFPRRVADQDFFPKFFQQQWKFCMPIMRYERLTSWPSECILPFTSIIPLATAAESETPTTYKVQLHPEYNKLRHQHWSDAKAPDFNTFVLKTFRVKRSISYQKEIEAYLRLRHQTTDSSTVSGLLQFHGSFMQNNSFNILMEYANMGNLEDYFHTQPQPTTADETQAFWEAFGDLSEGLMYLQKLSNHHEVYLQGWHQEVKPENILVVKQGNNSPHHCKFVLADLGLNHFMNIRGQNQVNDGDEGTFTYRAPESYRTVKNSSSDIFGLGCVLSEVLTWTLHGQHGSLSLGAYRENRIYDGLQMGDFQNLGRFHDGRQILPSVKWQHAALRKGLLGNHGIILQVLDAAYRALCPRARDEPALSLFEDLMNAFQRIHPTDECRTLGVSNSDNVKRSPFVTSSWLLIFDKLDEQISPGVDSATRAEQEKLSKILGSRKLAENFGSKLKNRDHVFLVDDSGSLQNHWETITNLGLILRGILPTQGMPLASSSNNKNTPPGKRAEINKNPKTRDVSSDNNFKWTNINASLPLILQDYNLKLQNTSKRRNASLSTSGRIQMLNPVKPLSIYVLTDESWKPNDSIETNLVNITDTVKQTNRNGSQFGIQFIRVVDKIPGSDHLHGLESMGTIERAANGIENVQAGNNLFRILLGAISRWYDDDDYEDVYDLDAFSSARLQSNLADAI